MRPVIRLRVLNGVPSSEGVLVETLRLRRSLAWSVGQAEGGLPPAVRTPPVGNPVVIEAFSGERVHPLFTGRVQRCWDGTAGPTLLVEEATGPLTRIRAGRAFGAADAGEAIRALCRDAGVAAVVASAGARFTPYQLLVHRSGMDQIQSLARLSGWLVRTDVYGRLHAGEPPAAPAGVLIRPDGVLPTELGGGVRLRAAQFRHTLSLADLPPADLGELLLLARDDGGADLARVISLEVTWTAAEGLTTRMDLQGIG